MPIWRLVPVDTSDPNWRASSHRDVAIVRAKDEATARRTAEAAFGLALRFIPGAGQPVPPWTRPRLVRAEIVDDPLYGDDGPAAVLEPSFARDLHHGEKPG